MKNFSTEFSTSEEHIIPQFLGGFWSEPIACANCNNKLGNTTDAEWQKNHEVIKALTELAMAPDHNVFKRTRKGPLRADGKHQYELVGYANTKSPFSVDRQKRIVNIDSRFKEDQIKGEIALTGMIQKDYGLSKAEVTQLVKESISELGQLQPGQKGKIERLFGNQKITISCAPYEVEGLVNMADHFIADIPVRSVVKIAYSFAATILQDAIYQVEYERIRKFLTVPDSGESVRVNSLEISWADLKSAHVLCAKVRHGKLYVILFLFHCMGFIVELGPAQKLLEDIFLFDLKGKSMSQGYDLSPEEVILLNAMLDNDFAN